jgi:ABC-2 type transport system ATP-binding protein
MIELAGVQKVVGQRTELEVAALRVGAGEVVAVVGPADNGQVALFALLTGQAGPTAGQVRVAGVDPRRDRDELHRRVGVLLADNALYERMSARDNLLFHSRVRGLPAARADEVLAQVGLADHATVPAGRLPSGLARRLALGRALLHRPTVLILVEPLRDCDPASSALLTRLIRELAAEECAILILDREVAGLAELCQTVHELEQGRIVKSYTPLEERPADLPFRVPAYQEDKVILLNPADILYVEVEEGRTWLYTAEQRLPTHSTLADLEQRLTRSGFFRAHRSYLVNLQRVKEVTPYTRDSFTLILDDTVGTEIPLSKTAARELRGLLGF